MKETKLISEAAQVGNGRERGHEEALQAWGLRGSWKQGEEGFMAGGGVSILGSFKGRTM